MQSPPFCPARTCSLHRPGAAKLARQAIVLQASSGEKLPAEEPLVADGLESFWVSQCFPNHFNVLVGASSQYLYGLTTATLRRSGRMRPAQRGARHWLTRRAFLSHLALSPAMLRAWLGAEHTPLRPDVINERLTPRYALQ